MNSYYNRVRFLLHSHQIVLQSYVFGYDRVTFAGHRSTIRVGVWLHSGHIRVVVVLPSLRMPPDCNTTVTRLLRIQQDYKQNITRIHTNATRFFCLHSIRVDPCEFLTAELKIRVASTRTLNRIRMYATVPRTNKNITRFDTNVTRSNLSGIRVAFVSSVWCRHKRTNQWSLLICKSNNNIFLKYF